MKLVFLGTTGYHPNEHRHTACLMLPEVGIVLDAGTGIFRARHHIRTPELDIFLTHAHLDHSLGLTFMFDVIDGLSVNRVTVHGEASKLTAIQEHLFSPLLFPIKPPLDFRALPATTMPIAGGGQLTSFPLSHPGGSIGFRMEWSQGSLAYVTDTTADPDAPYVDHIRDVDLLIHECYFPDGHEDRAALIGHSCASQVAQVAARCGAKRLMLVHVNPMSEEEDPVGLAGMREVFEATEIARDMQEVEF